MKNYFKIVQVVKKKYSFYNYEKFWGSTQKNVINPDQLPFSSFLETDILALGKV